MKEYVLICEMFLPNGGSFRYANTPVSETKKFEYRRDERELFIEKWKHLLNNDIYYDNIKAYFVDYESEKIVNITNRFNELKEAI